MWKRFKGDRMKVKLSEVVELSEVICPYCNYKNSRYFKGTEYLLCFKCEKWISVKGVKRSRLR